MLKDKRGKLTEFFTAYDPTIRRIIDQVLQIEQEKIDEKRPRVKDEIREVIEREVKDK